MNLIDHYELTIKEHHVDSLGHVNNATYLQIFEEARWEIITARGYGFKEVQNHQKGPVILELNLKFKKEVYLREKIKIQSQALKYEGKIGTYHQVMLKEDGNVASELTFTVGLFDMQARRLIEPTVEWKKALGME